MATSSPTVYKFKITLQGRKKQVWRRILVPDTYTFYDLHVAIQDAMGWHDSHMHKFEMFNTESKTEFTVGTRIEGIFDDVIPEKSAKIAEYCKPPNHKVVFYTYDFGMDWVHEVELEEVLLAQPGEKYPQCLDGKTVCPGEDGNRPDTTRFSLKSIVFRYPAQRLC